MERERKAVGSERRMMKNYEENKLVAIKGKHLENFGFFFVIKNNAYSVWPTGRPVLVSYFSLVLVKPPVNKTVSRKTVEVWQ